MKTKAILLICFLLFAFLNVKAQKIPVSKVPEDVQISFKYKYPDASVSYWEKSEDNYHVKFKMNDQTTKAEFDEKGLWIQSRTEVKQKELPSPVIDYYRENYFKQDYVMSVIEIIRTSQGESYYFILLKKEGTTQPDPVELHFDLAGKLLYKNDAGLKRADEMDNENAGRNKTSANVVIEPVDDGSKYLVNASKVPAAAKTHFASKNKKAAGTAWYLKDNKYTVKYNMMGKNGQASYTKEGAWIETRLESSEDKLNQLAINYLKDNYRQYKVKSVEYVTQPKNKFIYIRMFDKRSKATPPPITEIWFTSAGKFMNVEKPDITDPYERDAQKRRDEKDKDFMNEVDQGNLVYENAANYNDKVDAKELPSSVINYVKQNYKNQIISSSRLVSDDELGNIYLLRVKVEGAKYGTLLYFNIAGNFLKKIDESETGMNKDNLNPDKNAGNKEDLGKQFGTPEERMNESELPSEIRKYLKKNYPGQSINQVYFISDEELGNCYLLIMKKTGEKKITKLYFDLDGNLGKSQTESL